MAFISDIDPATPGPNDSAGQGDDQIRGLKSDISATLGGLDGPVTEPDVAGTKPLTAATISSWESRIAALEAAGGGGVGQGIFVPGMIMIWPGADNIPAGWSICDGGASDGNAFKPDLRDKFVLGASLSNSLTTGGNWNQTSTLNGEHGHGLAIDNTVLTEAQLPPHDHAIFSNQSVSSGGVPSGSQFAANRATLGNDESYAMRVGGPAPSSGRTSNTGSNQGHSHTGTAIVAGNHTHSTRVEPPFIRLIYIIYIGA